MPTPVASQSINLSEVLGPRYEVVRELGRGAAARVLLVEDTRRRRRCALKLLDPALAEEPR